MAKITLPTPLRGYADKNAEVELEGSTISELLGALTSQYPDLKRHLYDDGGKLRNFVNVYVNDEDIRYLEADKTPVTSSDVVSIIPSIAGGTQALEELNHEEIRRYSRHLILPEIGMDGQRKLKSSSVLLIGTGGLGSPAAMYLAAAGVGHLGIVDFDIVDESNLQRQIVHGQSSLGQRKVDSAKKRLLDINPHIAVTTIDEAFTSDNALQLAADYDVVADGTDNFPTRYLVNDACVMTGKPNVYASIFRFEGQATVFNAKGGPCYRCLYAEPPPPGLVPSCAEGGVLGILPGVLGVIQATEVVKLLVGIGDPLVGRLLLFDALDMNFRQLKLRKDPKCAICSDKPSITELIDYEQFCGVPAHDHETQNQDDNVDITAAELKNQISAGSITLLDVREKHEWDIGRIQGATLVPLRELSKRLIEFNPNDHIVLYCKMGGRSKKALELMARSGFTNLKNLKGGINAWSREVDSSVPLY